MRRLTVLMTDAERKALDALAAQALRDPRDQMRVILREEAQRQGIHVVEKATNQTSEVQRNEYAVR